MVSTSTQTETYTEGASRGTKNQEMVIFEIKVGIYEWFDGRKYAGSWKADMRTGKGKYTWEDGTYYQGDWLNDMREGVGQVVYQDGKVIKGTWVKDMMHGTFLVKKKDNSSHTEVWIWGNCERKHDKNGTSDHDHNRMCKKV